MIAPVMALLEIAIVLLLTLFNGVLALSEMAVVSSRRPRLEFMAGQGNRGARLALRMLDDPSRLLSTVQTGITLVGVIAGAYSGATLGQRFGDYLDQFVAPWGQEIGVSLVLVSITYVSLVFGELVPKRVALGSPEKIAAAMAPLMYFLSKAASPAVWFLKVSTDSILHLLGRKEMRDEVVTEEEVRSLIAEGTEAGVFVPEEREMIDSVLRLADRSVSMLMTPRTEVVWVDLDEGAEGVIDAMKDGRHSRLLVCKGSVDEPVGVVHAKDLVVPALRGGEVDIGSIMVPPIVVPENAPVLRLIEEFRRTGVHMALVVDEFGTTLGIVTLTDLIESIAGAMPEMGDQEEPWMVKRADGSWLVDGLTPVDEFEDKVGLHGMAEEGDFNTLAGFILERLGHLPTAGEHFTYRNVRFEVVDMDGRRIDKILVSFGEDS